MLMAAQPCATPGHSTAVPNLAKGESRGVGGGGGAGPLFKLGNNFSSFSICVIPFLMFHS